MSYTPWQPADPSQHQPPTRNRKRPLIALLVLVAGIIGGILLGLYYLPLRSASNLPAGPSPTLTTVAGTTPAPERSGLPSGTGGLIGPEAGTATSTALPETAQPQEGSTEISSSPVVPAASPTATPLSPAQQALLTLDTSDVPERDLYSIAARLKLKSGQAIPHTTGKPAGDYKVGHVDTFFISDLPNKRYYTVTATIREVTDHAYWYTQNGKQLDRAALKNAAQKFDKNIYPTDHRLFGSEWTPGVDNDPRITVLFADTPGAGGYFSSADEYTRQINPFSNEREIIYINADPNVIGGWTGVESTLAHEFQHMIHWHEHANHDVWLNEGSSELASAMNGYQILGVDNSFMREPDTQLNAWQSNPTLARANYGASFLFLDYLRTHYGGDDMIKAVVAAPGQGTDAISSALKTMGKQESFVDVFKKWALANMLDGRPGADAQGLSYPDREVSVSAGDSISSYPAQRDGTVSQFGTDYIELLPPDQGGTLHLDFAGQAEVPVIASPAHSGSGIWWSNRGDLADSSMTRNFDLSRVGSATLDYYIWLDTEVDLDYGYVEASTNGGVTWDSVKGKYTTATNPNGTNFGNGYSGKSADIEGADENGWLRDQVDLSKYAGKETLVRFEYITDDGYNAGGIAIDDISIPQIGYSDGAEADSASGWQMQGFARVANKLPQSYFVAVIKLKKDGFEVQPLEVSPDGKASVAIDGLGTEWEKAVLVVAGTTPHNIQQTSYTLSVTARK